jgi:hypothetical protein
MIGYLVMYYSQHWYFGSDSLYGEYFIPCQAAFISGIAFTYYGVKVAPSQKKGTAFVLMVVMLLLTGAGLLITIVRKDWLDLIKDILAAIGACMGYGSSEVDD